VAALFPADFQQGETPVRKRVPVFEKKEPRFEKIVAVFEKNERRFSEKPPPRFIAVRFGQ
jgi:hypothetical protein